MWAAMKVSNGTQCFVYNHVLYSVCIAGSILGINSNQGTVHLASQSQPGHYRVIHNRTKDFTWNNPLVPFSINEHNVYDRQHLCLWTYGVIVWRYKVTHDAGAVLCRIVGICLETERSMPSMDHPPVYRLVSDDCCCVQKLKLQRRNAWSLFSICEKGLLHHWTLFKQLVELFLNVQQKQLSS